MIKNKNAFWKYLLVILSIFVILFLGLLTFERLCDVQQSQEVVFKDEYLMDYEDKAKCANENVAYLISESQYMTMFSYPTDVVFAGDSITYRCQWNEIFPELSVKNRGIPSDTTEGLKARIDSIIQVKPKKVFIMIGINDLAREVEDREIIDNYCNIVDALLEVPDIELYVESILPVSENGGISKEKIIEINGLIAGMCKEKGIDYIDLHQYFTDEKGWLAEQYSTEDGVHITARGYECWKNSIKDYVY